MQKRNNLLSPFKYLSGKFFSNNNKWDLIGYQFVTIVREVSEKELWIFTENRDQAFPSSLSVSLTAFDCNVNVRQNHGTYNVRFEKASRYRHAERERERERESLSCVQRIPWIDTPRAHKRRLNSDRGERAPQLNRGQADSFSRGWIIVRTLRSGITRPLGLNCDQGLSGDSRRPMEVRDWFLRFIRVRTHWRSLPDRLWL